MTNPDEDDVRGETSELQQGIAETTTAFNFQHMLYLLNDPLFTYAYHHPFASVYTLSPAKHDSAQPVIELVKCHPASKLSSYLDLKLPNRVTGMMKRIITDNSSVDDPDGLLYADKSLHQEPRYVTFFETLPGKVLTIAYPAVDQHPGDYIDVSFPATTELGKTRFWKTQEAWLIKARRDVGKLEKQLVPDEYSPELILDNESIREQIDATGQVLIRDHRPRISDAMHSGIEYLVEQGIPVRLEGVYKNAADLYRSAPDVIIESPRSYDPRMYKIFKD